MQNNMMKMLQQAQEMQAKLADMQNKLGELVVVGEAGGGMVKITMACNHTVKAVHIDESVITPSEREMLEDLIVAAMVDAKAKVEAKISEETKTSMGGFAGALGGLGGGLGGLGNLGDLSKLF